MSARRSRRSLWITPVLSNQRLPPTLESRWPIARVCSPPADGNAQVPSPDCPGLLHRRTGLGRGPDPGRTGDWRCRTLKLGKSAGLLIRPAEGDPLGRTCGFDDKPMWLIQQCFSLPPAGCQAAIRLSGGTWREGFFAREPVAQVGGGRPH